MTAMTDLPRPHLFNVRVYYEDTDLAGIVYHTNYLKFMERARTESLRSQGIDQTGLEQQDCFLAVRSMDVQFLASARIDDLLDVTTLPVSTTGARGVLDQRVVKDGQELCTAMVTVVCVNGAGRPIRMPADVRAMFKT